MIGSAPVAAVIFLALASSGSQDFSSPPKGVSVHVLDTQGWSSDHSYERVIALPEAGEAVGAVQTESGPHAAHWSKGGELTELGTTGGCDFSIAYDINNSGAIVGCSMQEAPDNAFIGTAKGAIAQIPLPGGCAAFGINDEAMVAFMAVTPDWLFVGGRWERALDVTRIQPPGKEVYVRDINAAGMITGICSLLPPSASAYRWSPEAGLTLLETPGGFEHSHGCAINDEGTVVGLSRAGAVDQATRWGRNGVAVRLPYAKPGFQQSGAYGVNDHGWIVGGEYAQSSDYSFVRGILWINDVPYDVNAMVQLPPGTPPIHIAVLQAINDQGQIGGQALIKRKRRAIRLDPLW